MLDSNGGKVLDGLTIGQLIHAKGYATVVANNATCASTCGLIWLSGVYRFVGTGSQIGFHAAFRSDGDEVSESGAANALIGAYLGGLGLSYDAIYYLTEKAPNDIQWLNQADAQRLGILYAILPETTTPPAARVSRQGDSVSEWLGSPTTAMPPAQAEASTTEAFAEGRQDRISYEQWYASLPQAPSETRPTIIV